MNITYQILNKHLLSGELEPNSVIDIKIDQTLTQDSTGTMAYLQLEEMGIDKVKTDLSVAYCDHQTIQSGFENADDHRYLQSVANRYGVIFSKVGNGICHQVHLERFAKPGVTLLGSDSHTPNAGGLGALAIGAGGLDVACAMAGRAFRLRVPEVIKVELKNQLAPQCGAKDVILQLLSILSVKGNVNKVIEYGGPGVKNLSVTQRATITNMGAELGVTTSIFPSDKNTEEFLKSQNRGEDYREIKAGGTADYVSVIKIDMAQIVPLAACPDMPDNVKPVKELQDIKVDQVIIGSCTNASYSDIKTVINILKGKKVHPDVSLAIACGSKNVLSMIAEEGGLKILLDAGARILECVCGPCIGMGLAPNSGGVSVRTFNRNFLGRSGTKDAQVYLVSPETAAATAIKGYLCDAGDLKFEKGSLPSHAYINESLLIKPQGLKEIQRGPNICKLPIHKDIKLPYCQRIIVRLGDNITTDHILPGGARVLPYRSNLAKISEYAFMNTVSNFVAMTKENCGGIIVAGENYGQGSSREHAALVPKYLGVDVIIAKSFARIHLANLCNAGILPLVFRDNDDYQTLKVGDEVTISYNFELMGPGYEIALHCPLSDDDLATVYEGGMLNRIRNNRI